MTRAWYGGPRGAWYGCDQDRIAFERDARRFCPGVRGRVVKGRPPHGYEYLADVPVRGSLPVPVRVQFARRSNTIAQVFPLGKAGCLTYKHRYREGNLCMWFPDDPPERRWIFADGLAALLATVSLHLFKEQWWRSTGGTVRGEWLGEEAPHDAAAHPPTRRVRRSISHRRRGRRS